MFRHLCYTSVLIAATLLALGAEAAPKKKNNKRGKKKKTVEVQPAKPLVLPLERFVYVRGETVPLAVREGAGTITLKPVDAKSAKPVQFRLDGPAVLDTTTLAPGTYEVLLDEKPAMLKLTLIEHQRKSAGAFINEQVWPVREEDCFAPLRQGCGVNVFMTLGNRGGYEAINRDLDRLLEFKAGFFISPTTRPTSFKPARGWQWELDNWIIRLSQISQSQLRYPAFSGFCYEWDAGNVVRSPSIFFIMGKMDKEWRQYQKDSNEALYKEFTKRTGLQPPTTREIIQYAAAIKRPEYGPIVDLPSFRWMQRVAKHMPPLPEEKMADLKKRIVAWHKYLMGLYGEGHRMMGQHLDRIDPAMAHTGSVNIDHGSVNQGHFTPANYQGLNIRHMSAWNDQTGKSDYIHQWLLSGALMNTTNPNNQPIWVAQGTGISHGQAGKTVRSIAHNLAQNGTGVGSAAEGGFAWIKGPKFDVINNAQDFMHRFSALAVHGDGDHGVAILYSMENFAPRVAHEGPLTPAWQALLTLTRLGYTPRFVTEEDIRADRLKNYKILTVWDQQFPLPDDVTAKIKAFTDAGGRVVADASTSVKLPGLEKLEVGVWSTEARHVYGWGSPNLALMPGGMPRVGEYVHHRLAPAVEKALGNTERALYTQADGATSDVTICQIKGGSDATYVIAINDSWDANHWSHMRWHQVEETLKPNGIAAGAMRYDLNEEKLIGAADKAFKVDLKATTARVFAVLSRPIAKVDLKATQELPAGKPLAIQVRFSDNAGKPLKGVLPFHLTIVRPDGSNAFEGYRSTNQAGDFRFVYPVPVNASAGNWTVQLRSQLTGDLVSLPVTVKPNGKPVVRALRDRVVVRQGAALKELVKQPLDIVLIGKQQPAHAAAAAKVKEILKNARIVENPVRTNYTLAYVATEAEKAENRKVDEGKALGRIVLRAHQREHFYSRSSAFRYGRNVVLLDLVNVGKDCPMAEVLDWHGLLWPRVSAAFPGKGKAVVQVIHDIFDPDADVIVIQAMDAEGLLEGAKALAKVPEDWVGTSVSNARLALMQQWNARGGVTMPKINDRLTDNGCRSEQKPDPYRLTVQNVPTKASEPKLPLKAGRRGFRAIPKEFDVRKEVYAQQRVGDTYINSQGTPGNPDLRFCEAVLVPVAVTDAGEYQITVTGQFRYSDRLPRSQGSWEEILKVYDEVVPKERKPLHWEIQLNDKTVGKLTPSKTEKQDVPIETLPFYSKNKPKSVNEEVVSELSATIKLPAGKHEVRLIYRNMIDGQLNSINIEKK